MTDEERATNAAGRTIDLTLRQQRILAGVRESICRAPESYDQGDWRVGEPTDDDPGCIATHIIAQDPALLSEARGREPDDGRYSAEEVATKALGLEQPPRLFNGLWPPSWFRAAGLARESDSYAKPDADDAVAVLDAVLSGRLAGVLKPPFPDDGDR